MSGEVEPPREAAAPPSAPTAAEKRHYLMALATMAGADQETRWEEIQVVAEASRRLDCTLDPDDLRTFDLRSIAWGVRTPALREALFQDLARVAGADRRWDEEELEALKFLGEEWCLPLPELPGVDWSRVAAPAARKAAPDLAEKVAIPRFPWIAFLLAIPVGVVSHFGVSFAVAATYPRTQAGTLTIGQIALATVFGGALSMACMLLVASRGGWLRRSMGLIAFSLLGTAPGLLYALLAHHGWRPEVLNYVFLLAPALNLPALALGAYLTPDRPPALPPLPPGEVGREAPG